MSWRLIVKFERKFTKKSSGPYEGIEWAARKSEIRNPDGKAVARGIVKEYTPPKEP